MIQWNARDYAGNSALQQGWARELIPKLRLRGDEHLLDIGCGDGKVTAEIASHLTAGRVVGLDSSGDMIQFANTTFAANHHPNLSFVVGDASALPFTGQFDVIFSNACLHWIYDHRPVLQGIRRSLKPDGSVLLQMGGTGNATQILRIIEQLMSEEPWRQYFVDFDFRFGFHGPDEYRRWLAEAKLRPNRVELIPKEARHDGPSGLASWIRTAWLPYLAPIPHERQERFITLVVNRHLEAHPLTSDGAAVVHMVRLEVDASTEA